MVTANSFRRQRIFIRNTLVPRSLRGHKLSFAILARPQETRNLMYMTFWNRSWSGKEYQKMKLHLFMMPIVISRKRNYLQTWGAAGNESSWEARPWWEQEPISKNALSRLITLIARGNPRILSRGRVVSYAREMIMKKSIYTAISRKRHLTVTFGEL